jgi:hypothetical protein
MLRIILLNALVGTVLLLVVACGGEQFNTTAETRAHAYALIEAQCPEKLVDRLGNRAIINMHQDRDGRWDILIYPDQFWIKEDGSLGQFVAMGVC